MIIFKRKHLSIKWGIFAGILVFLAILLLLLFLLQTVYLDDIYKAAKKNTLNNANDNVEQILDDQLGNLSVMEQQLDELTAEYDIDIQISGEDGTLLYSSLRMYENTLPKQFYQDFYKRAEKNGGSFTEEIAGDIQRDPFDLFAGNGELPRSEITERDCTGKHGERKNFDNQQYTISYNCKRMPHTSKCHRADDSSGTNICLYYYDYFGTCAGYGDLTAHLKAAKPDE